MEKIKSSGDPGGKKKTSSGVASMDMTTTQSVDKENIGTPDDCQSNHTKKAQGAFTDNPTFHLMGKIKA